jgi:polyhydroxyalkanoate synthesis regulator phasin
VAAKRSTSTRSRSTRPPVGLAALAEQLVDRILKPLGLVVLSREHIQETLEEAARRGRVTRSDANELAAQLIQQGRRQTDELFGDLDRFLGRGRQQLDSAALKARRSEPVDRLVRGADRARRTVRVGAFPIMGYDDLTVPQIRQRLGKLSKADLRKVRTYERRHRKRKSLLDRIEKLLA